jgi:anti-anti-sigma factor
MEALAYGEAPVSHEQFKAMVTAEMQGTRLVVVPHADLARDAAPQFREELLKLVELHKPEAVTVDFREVHFLGSAALGVLVELMKLLGQARRIDVMNINQTIRTVFEITRLTTLFPIREQV